MDWSKVRVRKQRFPVIGDRCLTAHGGQQITNVCQW